jgi:hypothetical protein
VALAGAIVAAVVVALLSAMLEAEYNRWAMPLSRAVVRIAGLINPHRAKEWIADVKTLQKVEADPALTLALAHLVAAPWLLVVESALSFAYWVRREVDVDRVGNWVLCISLAVSISSVVWYTLGSPWALIGTIGATVVIGVLWGVADSEAEDGPGDLLPGLGLLLGLSFGLGSALQAVVPIGRFVVPIILVVIVGGMFAADLLLSALSRRSRPRRVREQLEVRKTGVGR